MKRIKYIIVGFILWLRRALGLSRDKVIIDIHELARRGQNDHDTQQAYKDHTRTPNIGTFTRFGLLKSSIQEDMLNKEITDRRRNRYTEDQAALGRKQPDNSDTNGFSAGLFTGIIASELSDSQPTDQTPPQDENAFGGFGGGDFGGSGSGGSWDDPSSSRSSDSSSYDSGSSDSGSSDSSSSSD